MNPTQKVSSFAGPALRRRLLITTTIAAGLSLLLLVVSADSPPDVTGEARRAMIVTTAALIAVGGILLCANVPPRRKRGYRWGARVVVFLTVIACAADFWVFWVNAKDAGLRGHFGANMRMFSGGLQQYAADNGGDFPPSLIVMAKAYGWPQPELESPSVEMRRPYLLYVTGLRQDDPGDWILLYEASANHSGVAGYILYVSGTVAFVEEPRHAAELRRFREQYEAARGAPPVVVEQKP